MSYRKKLIEVTLPLNDINYHSSREKSIRHGHPSTLHLWWSRKPLATCRAVLFASLIDDPGNDLPEEEAAKERERLFALIRQLVEWENSNNEQILTKVRAEILKSTEDHPPTVMDPFCGGGSIPLEAQRLGLKAYAGDLNPVAVLITKAMIEIPPKFGGKPPVNPRERHKPFSKEGWRGGHGLARDISFYGQWMREEAEKRIGHLYPQGPDGQTVIAWLWARTVKCPNPACGAQLPLANKFWLSKKKSSQAWVEPVVDRERKSVCFEVKTGEGEPQEGTVNRRGARCIVCNSPVPFDHVRQEGQAGRMGRQLMAIVAEGVRGRIYLQPDAEQVKAADEAVPAWRPDAALPKQALGFRVQSYGMTTFADLFMSRQLVTLTTFSDLVAEAREKVLADAISAGLVDDGVPLNDGGTGATAYADAVATYLAIAVDKTADRSSVITSWDVSRDNIRNTFARQAISMTWDFTEGNPFSDSTGNWLSCVNWVQKVVEALPFGLPGRARQMEATSAIESVNAIVVSTDPPYYDNIGYADLSDFFYVWLRRSIGNVYPDLFRTMLTPKDPELVAKPYSFGGDKRAAEEYFKNGLLTTFQKMYEKANNEYPFTIYYAFKQSESEESGDGEAPSVISTGWETMLASLIDACFQVTGTWPIRTELSNRPRASGSNALASSIVMVCRPRPQDALAATRREFLSALRKELPAALRDLQKGNIAPVDLAQACIGPGMSIFSRYSRILEADGGSMSVRSALALINHALDEYLNEQDSEYDADTRWALTWFEQHGHNEADFGEAETLSKARDTSMRGLEDAGILTAKAGKVKLLSRKDYIKEWDSSRETRPTIWKMVQYAILALDKGEKEAIALLRQVGGSRELIRDLAYRLYSICERRGWQSEAFEYNRLVTSWADLIPKAGQRVAFQTESNPEV